MLQQIDITGLEGFNLIPTENRNNHRRLPAGEGLGGREGGGVQHSAHRSATPKTQIIALTLAGAVGSKRTLKDEKLSQRIAASSSPVCVVSSLAEMDVRQVSLHRLCSFGRVALGNITDLRVAESLFCELEISKSGNIKKGKKRKGKTRYKIVVVVALIA